MRSMYLLPLLPVRPLAEGSDDRGEEKVRQLGFSYFSPLDSKIVRMLEDIPEETETPQLALAWTASVEPRQMLIEQPQFFNLYELDFSQAPMIVRLEDPVHLSKGRFIPLTSPRFQLEMTNAPEFAPFILHHLKMFEKVRLRLALDRGQGQRTQRNAVAYQSRSNIELLSAMSDILNRT